MTWSKVHLVVLPIVCWFLFVIGITATAPAAEIQMQVQAVPPTQSALSPTGQLLTIEDAVRIGSQQAVLGQQMSAYYPTIIMSNQYRTAQASSNGGNDHAADAFASLATFNMTLYNFGKREGNVQAARETLDATKQDYETTSQ